MEKENAKLNHEIQKRKLDLMEKKMGCDTSIQEVKVWMMMIHALSFSFCFEYRYHVIVWFVSASASFFSPSTTLRYRGSCRA
jgi:hypothetical protein